MANCNKLFLDFDEDLNITSSKRTKLIKSRDNIRDAITDFFKKNHSEYTPEYYIQGSYKLGTLIRTKDDTCDLDNGVYFMCKKPSVTCTTIQGWVYDAVKDITDTLPEHKRKCIRVIFKGDYHIDLPVYYELEDKKPMLAIKNDDWTESDPVAFQDWFLKKQDEDGQLKRIVKYLKSWCDNLRNKMPSGLAMTVLASNYYVKNERDDIALKTILDSMKMNLNIIFSCTMPVTPYDDLFGKYDETRKKNFLSALDNFVSDATAAVNEPNQKKSSKLWKKHLGDRFPEGLDENVDLKLSKLTEALLAINSGNAYTTPNYKITSDAQSGIKNQPHKFFGE